MSDYEETQNMVEEDLSPRVTTHAIDKYFPMMFGKRRTGEIFVRNFISAGLRHKEGRNSVVASFEAQAKVKDEYRSSEISGHDARFAVYLWDSSEIVFSKFISDWLMTNSMIATLWRGGWTIFVK